MADTSFYGGKPGFSFIIVKSFASVAEMVENFKKGPTYSAVHYDEHILINTENKNNPDNGKIYRRGYDYTNSLGGAIYIGTIVGPAGKAPMLELTSIEEVKEKCSTQNFEGRYGEGKYSTPVSLIPGKDGDIYNDSIEWACCCIRNENNEDSTAYIGFKFPYMVIDFTAQTVNPYYNRNNNTSNFINQNLVNRTDNKKHPFYEKWNISVPKGIKGDAFKNFRVMVADNTIQDYAGRQDDIDNKREVLVYDYYHYDKNENGEPISIFLGNYNMINNIDIEENGTIIIHFSHDDDLVYNKILKYIDKVYLNNSENNENNDYKFHVVYNTGEEEIIGDPINYILETDIDKDNDYHLLVYYSSIKFRNAIIAAGNGRTHKGKEGWLDLGSVKDDSGVLIGLNVPLTEAPNLDIIDIAIDYLNNKYPKGLTNSKFYGKIVTIGGVIENKKFYAFDYDKNKWYYLGTFDDDKSWTLVCKEEESDLEKLKNKLAFGGVWFIVEGEDD